MSHWCVQGLLRAEKGYTCPGRRVCTSAIMGQGEVGILHRVLIIVSVLLLALAAPAMAEFAPAAQATGDIQEPAPGGFQWSRFSMFGQGNDSYVSIHDPKRLGDLKWSPGKVANPYAMRLPFEPPIGSLTARFQPHKESVASTGPMFEGTASERSPEANGGYMALEWRTGSLALTLGGGYSEASAFTGNGGSSSGRSFASTGSSSSTSGGAARYDALRRYGAYLAAPYQLTDRIGLRPEVSYFYEDSLSGTATPGNEWVMGLQCSFGF